MTARRHFISRLVLAASAVAMALTLPARAADRPYDESADAKAQVRAGLAEAAQAHVPLLLIFGANWCKDCRALDAAMSTGPTATLMSRRFRVVKVDVGNFDRNLDLVAAYGQPTKGGIPAAVVVTPGNEVLYATKAGELADARHMSDQGILQFFEQAANAHPLTSQGTAVTPAAPATPAPGRP